MVGNSFGRSLGEYVKFKNYHQGALAEEVLMSKGQLSKVLTGRSNIMIDDAIAILEVLDVSLEFILCEAWKLKDCMGYKCKIPVREVPKTAFKKGENQHIRRRNNK